MARGLATLGELLGRRRGRWRRRRHLEIQVDIQARELYLEFSLMEMSPGEAFSDIDRDFAQNLDSWKK